MPTAVRKRGKGYVVVEKSTGEVKSHHKTRELAESSRGAREGGRRGWKPTGKPRRSRRVRRSKR